jgi:predicted PurR-regulated permease PerM
MKRRPARTTEAAGNPASVPPAPQAVEPETPSAPAASLAGPVSRSPLSPRWSASAKLLVGLTGIFLAGAVVVRFRALLQLLVIAAILAFLLVPIVRLLHRRGRLSWRLSTHLVFLLLVLLLIVGFTATGLALAQEVQSLVQTVQTILLDLPGLLNSVSAMVIVLGPFRIDLAQFDLPSLAEQAMVYVRPFLGQASGVVTSLAGGAIETVVRTVFIMAAAYFFTLDQPIFGEVWKRTALPGFQYDWTRLQAALDRIWAAFLRGQIVLGLVIATVVTLGLSILGVRNALVLGLVSGLLEFIPIVGPVVAGSIAALVSFFQGSNWWGLDPLIFTLVVIAFFIVVQQLENNLLVPRILGNALSMHPVVILVAAVIGATLAGILGILLSAPTMATLILLGRYVYRKVFDLPPWDPPIDAVKEGHSQSSLRPRWPWRRRTVKPGREHAG